MNLFEIKFLYPANVNGKDKVLSGKVGISANELSIAAIAVSQMLERYFPTIESVDTSTGESTSVKSFEIIGATKLAFDEIKSFDSGNSWYAAKCIEIIEEKKVATTFIVYGDPNRIYDEVKSYFYDATISNYRDFTVESHKALNWLELLDVTDSVIPYFESKAEEEVDGE